MLYYMVYNLICRLGFNCLSSSIKNVIHHLETLPDLQLKYATGYQEATALADVVYIHVLINLIFENNSSTHAILKENINDNFNKYMQSG